MKKIIILYFFILTFLGLSCRFQIRELESLKFRGTDKIKIFILLSEKVSSFESVKKSYTEELQNNYEIISFNMEGEFENISEIAPRIQKLKPDLILCIGSKSLEAVAGKIKNIPILFSMVLDYQKLNVEKYENIAGISLLIPPEIIFYNFRHYFEEVESFAVMSGKNSIKYLEEQKAKLINYNIKLYIIEINNPSEVPTRYQKYKSMVEGFWMTPDLQVVDEESFLFLVDKTIQDKKKFIVYSEKFVEAGALFSTSPNYSTIGSQLAIKTRQILEDRESPASVGISPIIGTFLTINKSTLKKLGKNVNMEGIDKVYE
jgi:putative ABC transport system substrate-binding protein